MNGGMKGGTKGGGMNGGGGSPIMGGALGDSTRMGDGALRLISAGGTAVGMRPSGTTWEVCGYVDE